MAVNLDVLVKAEAAFELALADAAYAREQWVAEGRPLAQRTQNGLSEIHPLGKALVEADDRVAKRAELVWRLRGAPGRGRPLGAVSAPDRKAEPPKVQLRRVGGGWRVTCEFDGCDADPCRYDAALAQDFECYVVAALKRIEERLQRVESAADRVAFPPGSRGGGEADIATPSGRAPRRIRGMRPATPGGSQWRLRPGPLPAASPRHT